MERFYRYHIAVQTVCALAVVASLAFVAAAQGEKGGGKKWPAQFPREGATKLFENERVIIWEQVGRPKTPFVHMHVRDTIQFGIEGGRIGTLDPDGKKTDGKAEGAATTRVYGGPSTGAGTVSYTKAGLGPHSEVATDPNSVSKTIFVELKGSEPKDCRQWSTACQ